MKKLLLTALFSAGCTMLYAQQEKKFNDTSFLEPVEVKAVRAAETAPFAKTNLSKKELEKSNLGQDLPFLLNQTPATVINSDAGNGVGYTGIRIRGTDATRINVTLNGIPYNDAESQGTFFVDLPDFTSSANSIQIQRGVGTSTNGTGAFGSSINLSTNEVNRGSFVSLSNSYGSFNTSKNNLQFGTGILGRHFTIEGRLSSIRSDGYIDRAKSNLQSGYFSTAYVSERNSLRLNIFSGKEKTYQAWNGVPGKILDSLRTYNSNGTEKPGTPYDNETDNYIQTHYQLFFNHKFNDYWKCNLSVFFTKGRGYYEEYKAAAPLSDYGLPAYINGMDTIRNTDLVRRLWLDNDFYGTIFSLQYQKEQNNLILGGGWNGYAGKHYGEVTWAQVQSAVPYHYHWYDLDAHKKDLSFFAKWTRQWTTHWQYFADAQIRNVNYQINGFETNPAILISKNFTFFNPKLGVTYTNKGWQAYASIALAAKEPIRADYEASPAQQPKPEKLYDLEWGFEKKGKGYSFGAGLYYMMYRDQLVLTGKINDVGAYTRSNISGSYRAGIELQGRATISTWMNAIGNISFSENRISNYTEYLDDYDNGGQQTRYYSGTTISFSPGVVGSVSLNFIPLQNSEVSFLSKYVSRQFLDNTAQRARSLNPYYLEDIRFRYSVESKWLKAMNIILQLNNVFNKKYEPSGYSYSYINGGNLTTDNYYYPMAGFNWMLGLNLRF